MPTTPWVTFNRPDADREYLVLLSELPLRRFRDLGRLFWYNVQVQRQLKRTPGVLGYSLMARIFSKRFWTLSVWEDESALQRFVRSVPHGRIVTALEGKMRQTRFVRWSIRPSEFPPTWREAFKRAAE